MYLRQLRAWFMRIAGLFGQEQQDRELAEELESHLQLHIDDNVRAGMKPEEARRQAILKLGGVTQTAEEYRRRRGIPMLEDFWNDLRYGARGLLRQRAFTVVALLTLALGIGANTAIFSIVNGVLLRPLPFPDADRVLILYETIKGVGVTAISVPNLRDWQQQNTVFEAIAAYERTAFSLENGDGAERLRGLRVEASYFDVLGIKPLIGRTFLKGEDEAGKERVVVLSYPVWRDRFASDAGVLNKTIQVNGQKYSVIGVMPPALSATLHAQIWSPLVFPEGEKTARGAHDYFALGRLKPGVSLEHARQQMNVIAARLEQQYPNVQSGRGAEFSKYEEEIIGNVRRPLLILMAAVAFVLLIACTNVANLLLARAANRQREIALRIGLGASRLRLLRQFITEGVLLAVVGEAIGIAVAWAGLRLFANLAFMFLPRSKEITLDLRVLGFTVLISLLTGIIFGVTPAAQALRTNVQDALKDGGKGSAQGFGGSWLRNLLVVAEVAATFTLLIGAGLLVKSFARLQSVDPGVKPDNVLTAKISPAQERYSDANSIVRFHKEVLERVTALPGVEAAGISSHLPVEEFGTNGFVAVEGKTYPTGQEPLVELRVVSPDYFRVMGISLLRGRLFSDRDPKDAPPGVVINETMAQTIWPGEDPIGKRVSGKPLWQGWVPVIGVVADMKNMGLTQPPSPEFYFDYMRAGPGLLSNVTLAVRSSLDPGVLAAAMQREVKAVDPSQPIYDVRTMHAVLNDTVADRRLSMTLIGAFAALALVLAVVGIYGVMSYTVARQTRDIGIRLALGAQKTDIHKLVLGRGAMLAVAGIVIGLAISFWLTRLMAGLLFNVSTTDPATFVAISMLLLAVAILACYIPARKAVKVDPLIALRYE
jgi:predicted permease